MKKLIRSLVIILSLLTLMYVMLLYKQDPETRNEHLNSLQNAWTITKDTLGDTWEKVADIAKNIKNVETPNPLSGQAGDNSSINEKISNLKADLQITTGTGNLVDESDTSPTKNLKNSEEKNNETGKENTASAYDFPAELYPYREMLSSDQKSIYDLVYENAWNLNRTIRINTLIDKNGLAECLEAVFNDHPELFWLNTSFSYGYTSGGTVVSVTLDFNETVGNIDKSREKFDRIANQIIQNAKSRSSDLEKEKYVYNSMMDIATYDESAPLNQSAYSALVNGKSVCAGYSRAFQYIMQKVGIPCYFVTGYANGGNHAWNITKIDGNYYNDDLSWDDSIGESKNGYSYEYFNITDKKIGKSHKRSDLSINLPACNTN